MHTAAQRRKIISASIIFLTLIFSTATLSAQQTDNYTSERERAVQLVNEEKYTEALPLLEKLAADKRADKDIFSRNRFVGVAASKFDKRQSRVEKNAAQGSHGFFESKRTRYFHS